MEKLRIYQLALKLIAETYFLIRKNVNLHKDYSLCDQLKRAAVSVVANIAEGYLRTKKQFKNYLKIASGSTNEVVALLQIISVVYKIDTSNLQELYRSLGRQIISFCKTLN
jgi:four helix bundle protein